MVIKTIITNTNIIPTLELLLLLSLLLLLLVLLLLLLLSDCEVGLAVDEFEGILTITVALILV